MNFELGEYRRLTCDVSKAILCGAPTISEYEREAVRAYVISRADVESPFEKESTHPWRAGIDR